MAFKMQCPKCNSTSLFLEEDQKAFVGGGRHQVQLHCYMCGKVIYGQAAIEAEYNKQMASWAKSNQNEPATPAASPQADSNKQKTQKPVENSDSAAASDPNLPKCAWKECDKAARPRSKYCSRNCSNKNARARYSKRSNGTEAA